MTVTHDHAHDHGVEQDADKRLIGLALSLVLAFMAAEVITGVLASSLALISDAGHMLTDAGALGLTLVTMRLAERPPEGNLTFGLQRAEILSAQANGITLVLLSIWFIYEAISRLVTAPAVDGVLVTWVAVAGIFINLLVTWVISKANRQSLNVEGSFRHILTDLYAFIATAIAGALIWATGFARLDALAALVVAALMLKAGYGLVKASGRIFLEAAPKHIDTDAVGRAMAEYPNISEVHDLHIWEVTSGFMSLSAHVLVDRNTDCHVKRRELEQLLGDRFHIHHTTLQMDHYFPEVHIAPEEIESPA